MSSRQTVLLLGSTGRAGWRVLEQLLSRGINVRARLCRGIEAVQPEEPVTVIPMISLFAPDSTSMVNVAHFMCESATEPTPWSDWKGTLPEIANPTTSRSCVCMRSGSARSESHR
jgi:hypothetical protein